MPLRRLTGSDDSIRPGAARSSGAFAMRREARPHISNSMQARLARERSWSTAHDQNRQEEAAGLLEHDGAAARDRIERPRFARLHASIAERQLDWAWHNSADTAGTSGESEPSAAKPIDTGLSARAMWLGGMALAVLATGVIAAVATLQSGRPLPFEIWARRDLIQRADGTPDAMLDDAMAPGRAPGRPEGASMPAPTWADAERADIDAALGSHARRDAAEVEIAVLGPILASAAVAERLAADLPFAAGSVPTAGIETRAERLLPEPPRPVFKPALASSSHENLQDAPRPVLRP